MNSKEELIKRKLVALFLNPPWKPWVIASKIPEKQSFKCPDGKEIPVIRSGNEPYEMQGLTLAKEVLGVNDEEIDKLKNYVYTSQEFSTALDRYLIEEYGEQSMGAENDKKVNVLDPSLEYKLHEEPPKGIDEFVCKVIEVSREILSQSKDLALLYNYLYGNIELIWYSHNEGYLPLDDPRVKTYTVFDRVYSTLSLLNWCKGDVFEGYLVKVDIPGVQDLISRSRKIYDLWGGSWLVSALLFFTILPFIKEYGADVVLSPFMGLNPFFHEYLRSELKKEDLDYMREFEAVQPVMPATAFLALPKDDFESKEKVKERIKEEYLKAWRTTVEAVVNSKEVGEEVKEELKEIEDYPIVPIRISVKDVKIVAKENNNPRDKVELVKEFDRLFREEFEEAPVKFSYGVSAYPLVRKVSEKLYSGREKKLTYKQCTNCGVLPAFIWRPGNTIKIYKFGKDEEIDVNEKDLEDGEALCYYCYLRRKLHSANFESLEVPFKVNLREKLGLIPSTIDLANLDKWIEIMECEKKSEPKPMSPEEELNIQLPRPLERYNDCVNCKYAWLKYGIGVLERFFVRKVEDREYKAEDECFNKIGDVNLYYAIVKGDGDFIGKRLWKGIIKIKLTDYIERTRVLGYKIGEKQEEFKEKLNTFAEEFKKYLQGLYNCSGNSKSEICDKIDQIIPITPDYLIAVSRSLMLVALKDLETVQNYGVIVYAGGDDIAFLSPLKIPVEDPYKGGKQITNTAIDLVKLTRRNYWGLINGEEEKTINNMEFRKGFISLEFKSRINNEIKEIKVVFDSPALYGRSYSVFVTHYKDPFYAMWGIATELEEMKDEAEAGEERQKDLTFVLGGRGMLNLKDAAVLENRKETFEALEALYENIGKGLSKSFVKDYLSAYEEIKDLKGDKDKYNDYLNNLLDYIIERNKKGKEGEKVREKLKDLKREREISEEWRKVYDPRVEVVRAYDYLEG
mgnify:CR=1 FL=1